MSENNKSMMDVFFKFLSAGLVPAAIWINSLSVDVALLKNRLESAEKRLDKVEAQQQKILEGVKENQIALKSMVVTMDFMKNLLTEIRNARQP